LTEVVREQVELEVGFVGKSIPRKEDQRLVQGEGVFVDDLKRHGMGYLHFVRSPYAHARIVSVDVSQAEAMEGVFGTLTPDEVAELTDPFYELTTPPGNQIKDHALAVGRVRHMGEPVVAVVADSRERARDAAELVEVEYEPLEVLVDARRAQDADAPILHDDAGTNVVWSGTFDWGDIDGALKAADHVIRIQELHFDRFSSTPLECAGAVV
jgi:2-furoyl-CoA dehydrogenase large subunit